MIRPPRSFADAAVFAAPAVFVLLWASGFIGAKLGLPYAEPMTFLTVRMGAVVLVLGIVILLTRPAWPSEMQALHSAVTGLFVHGCYLGGVFVAIDHKLPAGFAALVVSLQPILTSTLANRLLGERVTPRQWAGLALGIAGVYLVVHGHTEGEAPGIAWAAATVGLIGMTIGTLYQKRFGGGIEWRTGFFIQYMAAAVLFALAALAIRNAPGAMDHGVCSRHRLAGVWPVAWRDLAVVFPDPASGRGAGAEPVLSDAAVHRADGLADVQRAAIAAGACRHGGLRRRRRAGELAGRRGKHLNKPRRSGCSRRSASGRTPC